MESHICGVGSDSLMDSETSGIDPYRMILSFAAQGREKIFLSMWYHRKWREVGRLLGGIERSWKTPLSSRCFIMRCSTSSFSSSIVQKQSTRFCSIFDTMIRGAITDSGIAQKGDHTLGGSRQEIHRHNWIRPSRPLFERTDLNEKQNSMPQMT